jgi:hypothetical protein
MIIAQRRDSELASANGAVMCCERCKRLEAENDRLRELVKMVAALAGEEDLAEKLMSAPNAHRW